MRASVRELKARLSLYLGKVGSGEDVVITSRGRPVARLLALVGTVGEEPTASELEQRLKRIPGVLPSRGGKPRGSASPMTIAKGQRTLSELVLQNRR